MFRLHTNTMLRIFWLFMLFFFCFSGTGISQDIQENKYLKRYYSVENGLSQSEVTSLVQDKYGFIWLGTRGGLNRFDGYNFLHFKPESGEIHGLLSSSIETWIMKEKSGLAPNQGA